MARAPAEGTGYLGFAELLKVPDVRTKRLGPLVLHPELRRVLCALDERTPDGLRRVRELVLHWFRQSGKTTADAVIAGYGLCLDPFHTDRLVVIAASDEEQGRRVFESWRRMCQRDPFWSKRVKFTSREAVYREVLHDAATGGQYFSDHLMRVLASGDIPGAAGMCPSTGLVDEVWTQDGYDLIEPLTQSPGRACPLTVYSSYSALRSQNRAGVPLFDLIRRGQAGDDAGFEYSYLGQAGWYSVPWVTPAWIERVRRQLANVPARFARLIENRVAAADDAFLTDSEICDATGDYPEPATGEPGTKYVSGLDVGLTGAWTGYALGHADRAGVFILDVLRSWKGAPGRPVSLESVEREILDLSRRFPLSELQADPWQAAMLGERLTRAGLPVKLQPIDAGRVDRLVSNLKQLAVRRLLRFDRGLFELREQLDSLTVVEAKNRGLLRFQAGGSTGAGKFTDLVFSLALACESLAGALGRLQLPEQAACCRIAAGLPADCFLWGGAHTPADPVCGRECVTWIAVRRAWQDAGTPMDLREFYKANFAPEPGNAMIRRARYARIQDRANWSVGG